MLLLRVNEVNDLELAPTLLSQQCGGFVGAAGAPLAVSLRLVKWPLSADCGRATSCKQMNWDDGENCRRRQPIRGSISVNLCYRELEPAVGGGSVVVQDDRTKWEGMAQVAE
jgi:hypothetical protein